jgi:hypothetical protein
MVNNNNERLGLLVLWLRHGVPEPGDPHGGALLVHSVSLGTMLLLEHAALDEDGDVGKAEAVDERSGEHPPLAQVPGEEVQPPPPELLAGVVWVARVAPEAILEGGDGWLAQLLELLVPGHEPVQLGIGEVSHDDPSHAGGRCHQVPDAPSPVAGVDGVHREAYADQEHLSSSLVRQKKARIEFKILGN